MHKIRDWLYVSDYATAKVPQTIRKFGIQGMLQLYQPIQNDDIETKFIRLQDGIPILKSQIQQGIDFIYDQHRKKHCILSTCGAGISRSVTMAIIALKEIEGLTMFEAYHSVRQKHEKALPDHVHWKSVAEFYGEDDDFWTIWGDISLLEDK